MDVTSWAENITKEVYSVWKDKFSFWKPGIKVFYSPPANNPKLLIISYQPGGSEVNFKNEDRDSFEAGQFQTNGNAYIDTDYKMAKEVRRLFAFKGGLDILKRAVVFPLIFFRAPKVDIWKRNIPKEIRAQMEQLCFSKVREIIDILNPQSILVLGVGTYCELKNLLGNVTNEKVLEYSKNGKTRIVMTAKSGEIKIFSTIHLTGARISSTDKLILSKRLESWLV